MTLNPGEVVALLGASGSGKTTLLRSVAGLEQPSRGRIAIGDTVLFDSAAGVDMPVEKRNLGLVFQSYALWPHRSVFDNVAYGLRLRGTPASEIDSRVTQALTNLGLGALAAAAAASALRRTAAARGDRARAGLQPAGGADGRAAVQPRRQAARGGAGVAARADRAPRALGAGGDARSDRGDGDVGQDPAAQLLGQIEQQGTPEEMYNRPQTQFTAEFMGSNNHLPGQGARDRRRPRAARRRRLAAMGRRARRAIKTGDAATGIIRLERTRIANSAGDNRLRTELVTGMFLGDRREHLFKLGALRLRCYGTPVPDVGGSDCYLELPQDDFWVFAAPVAAAA